MHARGRFLVSSHRLLALVAAAGILWMSAPACRSETDRLFSQALAAMRADDYQAAVRSLREIAIAYPGSAAASRARYELAQIYLLRIRDVGAAHATLLEALKELPEGAASIDIHRLVARVYEKELASPQKAIPHLEMVLDSEVGVEVERETLLSLGDCHYRMEQIPEAVAAYRRALALPYDPATDAARLRLAALARLAGRGEEALGLLEDLASRTPDAKTRHEAVLGQAELLMEREDLSEARTRLREARKLAPDSPENDTVAERLRTAQVQQERLEPRSESIEELQRKIRWGSGRRARSQR